MVQVHWSALLIVASITATAAVAVLPAASPGLAAPMYWLVSFLAAALFMASLVMHELAHVLVARRHGLRAESVTVWVLGGVTLVEGEPDEPGADFRLAAVGPLASLLAAFGALGAAVQAFVLGVPAVVVAAFVWVAVLNAFVAAFSLLPAYPLDGARMLGAAVWRVRGRASAVRVIAWTGVVLGVLLVCAGSVELVVFRQLGGLPLVVLGCFFVGAWWRGRPTAGRSVRRVGPGDRSPRASETADRLSSPR